MFESLSKRPAKTMFNTENETTNLLGLKSGYAKESIHISGTERGPGCDLSPDHLGLWYLQVLRRDLLHVQGQTEALVCSCWVTECCRASAADGHWPEVSGGWSELNRRVYTARVFDSADTAGDESSSDAGLTPGRTSREACVLFLIWLHH